MTFHSLEDQRNKRCVGRWRSPNQCARALGNCQKPVLGVNVLPYQMPGKFSFRPAEWGRCQPGVLLTELGWHLFIDLFITLILQRCFHGLVETVFREGCKVPGVLSKHGNTGLGVERLEIVRCGQQVFLQTLSFKFLLQKEKMCKGQEHTWTSDWKRWGVFLIIHMFQLQD